MSDGAGGAGLTRRRLIWLAGAAGVGAAAELSGCARRADPSASAIPAASELIPAAPQPISAPVPESIAPPPRVGASAPLLCREAWGARPPRGPGVPHTPNRMTVHHTEVVLGDNSDAPARLRQHQRYHQDSHGWIDIAYHVGVDRNGNIYQLRSPEIVGDTATGYDPTGHFLVVCEGDFDREPVSDAQLNAAALVFAWAAQRFAIATDTLAGHRDVSDGTTCPGESLYAHVTSGDLKRRIDGFIADGPVDLHVTCGPEAAAIVADIEAGRR